MSPPSRSRTRRYVVGYLVVGTGTCILYGSIGTYIANPRSFLETCIGINLQELASNVFIFDKSRRHLAHLFVVGVTAGELVEHRLCSCHASHAYNVSVQTTSTCGILHHWANIC